MAKDIHWFPGHMAKATREIEERVKLVDLIIELRDARAPLSTANPLIGAIKNKPHLIILTKIDMADPKETDKWVDFYYEFHYNMPSKKECLAFEKEVSLLFANDEICCSISHLDFASDKIKEDGCIWTN